jgi:hypothetical protein
MVLTFEDRNIGGIIYKVALYNDLLYRMDREDDNRPLGTAVYKYFTTNENEAILGYSREYQILRRWRPRRTLVLLHLFNVDTRAAFRALLNEEEQANLNFAFPLQNNVVSRVSEEDSTNRDYRIADAVCRIFREHGLDGYYVGASSTLHSEVMLCQHTLQEGVLEYVDQKRIAPPAIKRTRAQVVAENEAMGFPMPQLPIQPPRTPPRAAANMLGAHGYQTPPRAAAAYGYQTPPRAAAAYGYQTPPRVAANMLGAQRYQTPKRSQRRTKRHRRARHKN